MFRETFTAAARINIWPPTELNLRNFFASHHEDLANAAALLAGRKGARIVEDIRSGLEQPGRISRRMAARLIKLFNILALSNVHDEDMEEEAYFAAIDPCDPIVHEICLLTDGLRDALCSAGLDPSFDLQS